MIRGCRAVCPRRARPEAPRRPSVCRAVCPLVAAVTRPPSGAKRYDSGGRCTAYMSPALSPLAYVLPCVPLVVPWLPSVCPWLVLPAAVCRLVAVIGGTPLFRGRRRCGAASAMLCCFCLWLCKLSVYASPSALIALQCLSLRPSYALLCSVLSPCL